MKKIVLIILLLAGARLSGEAADAKALLSSWLAAQPNIHTWSADFVQTRSLKALTQPLTSTGHVFFAEPNLFRWELGNPAKTIAVRSTKEMLVIYPQLKRVERYALNGEQAGQWKEMMELLDAGFPRRQAELESHFNILSQTVSGTAEELALQPKSAMARKMMPLIRIAFDTENFSLRSTELEFADGSRMRNDFKNPVLNPPMKKQAFEPPILEGYKIVEPLKKQ